MFDLSFSEILLIVVMGVVFIKADDLPVVIRSMANFMKTLRGFVGEIKQTFDDISHETGLHDVKTELDADVRMIKGDDGKYYESYDMPDISAQMSEIGQAVDEEYKQQTVKSHDDADR